MAVTVTSSYTMLRVLACLVVALPRGESFFEEAPRMESLPADGGDPGQPLFLTPYIEAGNLEEGRRLARVSLPDLPESIQSYSGFVTVNKTYNSNLFFWYFLNETVPHKVLRVHIQGFPGVSSLFDLFEEYGSIKIVEANGTLKPKQSSIYNKYDSKLYIDHAVGAGFSFTNDSRGYCTGQEEIGDQLYSALFQIMKLFPELQKLSIKMTGDLYAGKFVVSLARAISVRKKSSDVVMKLSDLHIGSGWCDPISQLLYHKYTYHTGLHDWRMADYIKQFEYNTTQLIKQEKWVEASEYFLSGMEMIRGWSGDVSYLNFMKDISDYKVTPKFVKFVQSSPARRALHVGDLKFQDGVSVRNALKPDLMKSVLPWISELIQHEASSLYFLNGALGVMVPYHSSVKFMRKLDPNYVIFPWTWKFKEDARDRLYAFDVYGARVGNIQFIRAGHLVALDYKYYNAVVDSYNC